MKKIMVIDDNKELAFVLMKRLEFEGSFEVIAYDDSEKAVKYACQNKIDLIITDYSMPKMNGGDVLKAIRTCCPQIKVAICSVYYDDDETISIAIKKEADLILKKPFDEEDICKINKILNLEVL